MPLFENSELLKATHNRLVPVDDIWSDIQLAAKQDSAEYALANMKEAFIADDRYELLNFAHDRSSPTGLVLEFGVGNGRSINHLAKRAPRTIHGFDSFEGLPADWRGTMERKGKFSLNGKPPKVRSNVTLYVGWFDKTLPAFLQTTRGNVALVHIDCAIYESRKCVLELLTDRIVQGTIIVFGDYFNYPGWRQHEYRAFQDFVSKSGHKYKYIGMSAEKGHVAI